MILFSFQLYFNILFFVTMNPADGGKVECGCLLKKSNFSTLEKRDIVLVSFNWWIFMYTEQIQMGSSQEPCLIFYGRTNISSMEGLIRCGRTKASNKSIYVFSIDLENDTLLFLILSLCAKQTVTLVVSLLIVIRIHHWTQ
jgi:hypothetical protein